MGVLKKEALIEPIAYPLNDAILRQRGRRYRLGSIAGLPRAIRYRRKDRISTQSIAISGIAESQLSASVSLQLAVEEGYDSRIAIQTREKARGDGAWDRQQAR